MVEYTEALASRTRLSTPLIASHRHHCHRRSAQEGIMARALVGAFLREPNSFIDWQLRTEGAQHQIDEPEGKVGLFKHRRLWA